MLMNNWTFSMHVCIYFEMLILVCNLSWSLLIPCFLDRPILGGEYFKISFGDTTMDKGLQKGAATGVGL